MKNNVSHWLNDDVWGYNFLHGFVINFFDIILQSYLNNNYDKFDNLTDINQNCSICNVDNEEEI